MISKNRKNNNFRNLEEKNVDWYGLGYAEGDSRNSVAMYNRAGQDDNLVKTDLSGTTFNNKTGENLINGFEDGIKLHYDNSLTETNIINCFDSGGSSIQCCKDTKDLIQWDQTKTTNSFSCESLENYPKNTPWPGHYLCTSEKEPNTGKKYREITIGEIPNIEDRSIVHNPEICDLTDKSIYIRADDLTDDDGWAPERQYFPLCSLIKNHISEKTKDNNVTPGCADVNHRLNTYKPMKTWSGFVDGACVYKDCWDIFAGCECCGINRIDLNDELQEGVHTSIYSGGGGHWGLEKDWMCREHPIRFNPTNMDAPYNCNWNWPLYLPDSKHCSAATYDSACAARFQLDPFKNPNACDDYNKSSQYNTLCANVNCKNYLSASYCPGQTPTSAQKTVAKAKGGFDINYHCCCDLEGYKNNSDL